MSENKKSHGVQLLIRTVVTDPDGKILSDSGQKPAKSFLIQFLEFIYLNQDDPGINQNATDVDGAETSISTWSPSINLFNIDAPINQKRYGIVIGTGDTAVDNEDNSLETQIQEGTGFGQITHGATVLGATAVVGANVDLEITRAFVNNSGAAIIAEEAGIYVKNAAVNEYHCIIRDVFGAPVNIPDKCSLTVVYTARTTA